jgi:hypothetical protein
MRDPAHPGQNRLICSGKADPLPLQRTIKFHCAAPSLPLSRTIPSTGAHLLLPLGSTISSTRKHHAFHQGAPSLAAAKPNDRRPVTSGQSPPFAAYSSAREGATGSSPRCGAGAVSIAQHITSRSRAPYSSIGEHHNPVSPCKNHATKLLRGPRGFHWDAPYLPLQRTLRTYPQARARACKDSPERPVPRTGGPQTCR